MSGRGPRKPVPHQQRLLQERERLERLAACSSALRLLRVAGDPPARFDLSFELEGETLDLLPRERRPESPAICRLTLEDGFPRDPPAIRWLSRMWHPGVNELGLTPWRVLQLPWRPHRGLDEVVVRLWELLTWRRWRAVPPADARAARWFADLPEIPVLDPRGLRDLADHQQSVVVGYRRTADGYHLLAKSAESVSDRVEATGAAGGESQDIVFLDEQVDEEARG